MVLYLPLNDEKSVSKSNYTVSFWFRQPGNLKTLIGQRYCHWNALKCRCQMVIVKRYIKQYRTRSCNRVHWVNIATNSSRSLLGQSTLYAKEHEKHMAGRKWIPHAPRPLTDFPRLLYFFKKYNKTKAVSPDWTTKNPYEKARLAKSEQDCSTERSQVMVDLSRRFACPVRVNRAI